MISRVFARLCLLIGAALSIGAGLTAVYSQDNSTRVLLVASCAAEDPCGEASIHRFVFKSGKLIAQEVVYKLAAEETHFTHMENRILSNRYVVSFAGAVLDLESRKLYNEKLGRYIGHRDGRIFIDQVNLASFHGDTYGLDLASGKYTRHSQPNFYSLMNVEISPDGTKAVTFDNIAGAFFVATLKGKHPSDFSTFRAAGKHEVSCGKKCVDPIPIVPSIWIDNDRFLTQRTNGDLILFDYPTRRWIEIARIRVSEDLSRRPDFFKDHAGDVFYNADKLYKIDVDNKRYSETNEFGLGHGFLISGRRDTKLFQYGDQKLASFISGNYLATEGYLAAEFQEQPLSGSPPIGIRVWGKDVGTWTTLRIKFRPHIIGWISE